MATSFGQKLRDALSANRMSAPALSARLAESGVEGASKSSIYDWLDGNSHPNILIAGHVARLLGISLDYLADESLDAPETPELTEDERIIVQTIRDVGLSRAEVMALLMGRQPEPASEFSRSSPNRELTPLFERGLKEATRPKKVDGNGKARKPSNAEPSSNEGKPGFVTRVLPNGVRVTVPEELLPKAGEEGSKEKGA